MCPLFLILDLTSKPMESLEQIPAFDIEKLLSKSSTLSENLLLQLTAIPHQGMENRICWYSSQRFCSETL